MQFSRWQLYLKSLLKSRKFHINNVLIPSFHYLHWILNRWQRSSEIISTLNCLKLLRFLRFLHLINYFDFQNFKRMTTFKLSPIYIYFSCIGFLWTEHYSYKAVKKRREKTMKFLTFSLHLVNSCKNIRSIDTFGK